MMVQFSYVTLFVAAFPLAPLICLLNNIVEIRIDATNFVTSFRRPLPARVSGIRIWRRFLNIIVKLSVLCNGAFLAFTSELIPTMVYRYTVSPQGTTEGYMIWSVSEMNTTAWPEFKANAILAGIDPNETACFYKDFRENNETSDRKLIWWQIMVARLAFFIVFIITFYFIQWLCDFLLAVVPKRVKLRVHRSNFLAREALYGDEHVGSNSGDYHIGNHFGTVNRKSMETNANMPPVENVDRRHTLANGHFQMVNVKSTPASATVANGAIARSNDLVTNSTRNSLEDEEKRWSKKADLPLNHLPVSPIPRPSFRHMNGLKSSRLVRTQTIESSNI